MNTFGHVQKFLPSDGDYVTLNSPVTQLAHDLGEKHLISTPCKRLAFDSSGSSLGDISCEVKSPDAIMTDVVSRSTTTIGTFHAFFIISLSTSASFFSANLAAHTREIFATPTLATVDARQQELLRSAADALK